MTSRGVSSRRVPGSEAVSPCGGRSGGGKGVGKYGGGMGSLYKFAGSRNSFVALFAATRQNKIPAVLH